jgi:hypothetical protein
MHIVFGIAAVLFVVLGFVAFSTGLTLVFWPLAAICVGLAIKFYPRGRKGPKSTTPPVQS